MLTLNPNEMFNFPYNSNKKGYKISIKIPKEFNLFFILIWNYNENIDKGVKLCKILYEGETIF